MSTYISFVILLSTDPAYASGGFIADSRHTGTKIINGAQQQFLARNMEINQWDGSVWNQVFLGVDNAPQSSSYPNPPITTLSANPLSREKSFLLSVDGKYFVRVPLAMTNTSGVSWDGSNATVAAIVPLSQFYLVQPTDAAATLNSELSNGKNLLFLPGVYMVNETISVDRADTVLLGIGHATLKASAGNIIMQVSDVPGVIIAGMIFDAGDQESPVLLQVGDRASTVAGDPTNPITLNDVYFRVGGPYIGKADICLEVNSDHVLIDHTWIWRADHGIEAFNDTDGFDGDNERWRANIGRNGFIANGDHITCTGLFVEHFQEYSLIWNGEYGRVYFYQNELPYDPPSQEEWVADDGSLGWAGYKVGNSVTDHEIWGAGVYCYNRNNASIVTANGFEVPTNPNIRLRNLNTRNLSGPGTIQAVINDIGGQVDAINKGPEYILSFM
jgi:hypothetical protein